MATIDALEGTIRESLWFHYDFANDVLYLRLAAHRKTPTFSEETPDGVLLLRRQDNDEPVGLTVVNWWKRFGTGAPPDSIKDLAKRIERWGRKLAA